MAEQFYIDFRLHGYAKRYAKWARSRIVKEWKKTGIRETGGRRNIPHMTLFGPAETHKIGLVIAEVERTCAKYTLVPFSIGGLACFENSDKDVIYLDINASPELTQLRYELSRCLIDKCTKYTPFDTHKKFEFHTTLGQFIPTKREKFKKLFSRLENHCSLKTYKRCQTSILGKLVNIISFIFGANNKDITAIDQHLLRVTIVGRGGRIMWEYDLMLKRFLTRREALSKRLWKKTVENFKGLKLASGKRKSK